MQQVMSKDKKHTSANPRAAYHREYSRKHYQANKWEVSLAARKQKYGLSLDAIAGLIVAQKNRCAICSEILTKWVIDHDHTTGKVRGILCPRCNNMIGLAHDNTLLLQAGIDYLERFI
jgi:hypothetical protein